MIVSESKRDIIGSRLADDGKQLNLFSYLILSLFAIPLKEKAKSTNINIHLMRLLDAHTPTSKKPFFIDQHKLCKFVSITKFIFLHLVFIARKQYDQYCKRLIGKHTVLSAQWKVVNCTRTKPPVIVLQWVF